MRARMPTRGPVTLRIAIGAGTTSSTTLEFSGWVMPVCTASSSRLMSTVSSTSAGLLAPSVLMRCSRPELAEITLTLTPVSLVKASNSGWISLPRDRCRC